MQWNRKTKWMLMTTLFVTIAMGLSSLHDESIAFGFSAPSVYFLGFSKRILKTSSLQAHAVAPPAHRALERTP